MTNTMDERSRLRQFWLRVLLAFGIFWGTIPLISVLFIFRGKNDSAFDVLAAVSNSLTVFSGKHPSVLASAHGVHLADHQWSDASNCICFLHVENSRVLFCDIRWRWCARVDCRFSWLHGGSTMARRA